jgi:hypothetical protein
LHLLNVGWVQEKPFTVDADLIATGRTCVVGASGSGKSYAVGVICEELCKSNVPFAVIDIEGEYSGLKERYEAFWVGEDEKCDLNWDRVDLHELATIAPDSPPLILDVSETKDARQKIDQLLRGVYEEVSKRRTPYLLILEEADRFAPQVGERLQIIDEVARRGRKRGLGLMLCTQRPAEVDKSILSQCANQLIGKLIIRNDLQSVSQFFPSRGLPKELTSLQPGNFYAMGGFSPVPTLVKIRARETRHGGITPKLAEQIARPRPELLARVTSSKPTPIRVGSEPSELLAGVTSSKPTPIRVGFAPSFKPQDIPNLVKKEKEHVLFGKEESTSGVAFFFLPLVEVGIRTLSGLLNKRYATKFFVIDGIKGKSAIISDHLEFGVGLRNLLGLKGVEISVLKDLPGTQDETVMDIAADLGTSEESTRKVLKTLEDKHLIRLVSYGRTKSFRRLVEIPEIGLTDRSFQLVPVDTSGSREIELNVREQDVREIVRVLVDGSDLVSFRTFYYPTYRVELALGRKVRTIWIDGISGKELSPPLD